MHLHVDTSSPVPPYEQIRAQLGAMVASGALAETFALEAQHHGAGLDDALAAVRQAFQRVRDTGTPITGPEVSPR